CDGNPAAAVVGSRGTEDSGGGGGESIPGQRFPEGRELHLHFFECVGLGNGGGEGAVWGDSHWRSFAGHDPEHRATRSGDGASRSEGRIYSCAKLILGFAACLRC